MSPPGVFPRVANRLTQVPEGSPPLDATQLRLLPVADLFMALMFSRPGGLSLRNTWVTPASLWLCSLVAGGSLLLGVVSIAFGLSAGNPIELGAGVVAGLVATGAGSVGAYGIRQRLLAGH